ncbi:MAG: hypothetical protein NC911_03910 [Candidatus Omnitrophica bacterium]|nr:hypothetical protein [Candidatus Omnitrophota bacterium]
MSKGLGRLLAVAIAVTGLIVLLPQAAQAAIGKQGNILYVGSVTRSDGVITKTGELYVKNLETGEVNQVTFFSPGATGMILNPAFSIDGKYIVFTSNCSTGGVVNTYFDVYKVASDSTTAPQVNLFLAGSNNSSYKYAALSPDGSTLIAAMEDTTTGRSYLVKYNVSTKVREILLQEVGMTYSHPAFLDGTASTPSTQVVYLGTSSGVQNIYRVDLTGQNKVNLTANTSGSVQYGRLMSAVAGGIPYIIYSRRQASGYSWAKWDVYMADASGGPGSVTSGQINLTQTPDKDELDPAFYGDNALNRDVPLTADTGNMLYSAAILSTDVNIWQANYDNINGSNTQMAEWTADLSGNEGQACWGPSVPAPGGVDIGTTRLVFVNNSQVFRVDFDAAGNVGTPIQVTNLTNGEQITHVDLNANGANIVYDYIEAGYTGEPSTCYIINTNGTNPQVVSAGTAGSHVVRCPAVSADGKWVVYAQGNIPDTQHKTLYVKKITADMGSAAQILTLAPTVATTVDLYDPAVAPANNQIAFSNKLLTGPYAGNHQIWVAGVDLNWAANTANVQSNRIQLMAGNSQGIWSDRYPSYSPDGSRIVFVSNRDSGYKIYTMDAKTGTDVQLFGAGNIDYTIYQNPTYPVFSPVGDGSIAFVAELGGVRQVFLADTLGNVTATGIGANPGDNLGPEVAWGIQRDSGTMYASRLIQNRAPNGTNLIYTISIDVDEMNKPAGYVLNDVMACTPVNTVWVDGTSTTNYVVYANNPYAGLNTLKLVFADSGTGVAGDVSDHVVKVSVAVSPATGSRTNFVGELVYTNPVTGVNTETPVAGGSRLLVANPYIPTDMYDAEGNIRDDNDNAVIEDADLLYTINEWKYNRQLVLGYQVGNIGPQWPYDTDNWDQILISIIGFWATNTYQGQYYYSDGGAWTGFEMYWTGVTPAQTP